MTKIIKKCLLIGVLALFVIWNLSFGIFNVAQAREGLVPCSGLDCDFCHLLTLVERIINFSLYKIAIPLSVVFIVYGGFVIMTSGGSAEKVKKGKDIIKAAVIGILIALLAWMLIATILKVIAKGEGKEGMPQNWWNPRAELKC